MIPNLSYEIFYEKNVHNPMGIQKFNSINCIFNELECLIHHQIIIQV
jgi:hypothetical protein